jgi:hypothetical protein
MVGASRADALVPSSINTYAQDIGAFVENGGIPSGRAPTNLDGLPTASELWLEEHRPMPNQASSQQLYRELELLRTRTKLLPAIGTLAGRVSLAASAFTTGWAIGTAARKLWIGVTVPPAGLGTLTHATVVVAGGKLTTPGNSVPTVPAVPDGRVVPTATLQGEDSFGNMLKFQQNVSPCQSGQSGTNPNAWDGWTHTVIPTECAGGTLQAGVVGLRVDIPTRTTTETPVKVYDPATDDASLGTITYSGDPSTADPAATAAAVKQELNTNSNDYPTLTPWLDAHLGGPSDDPTGQVTTKTVPNCEGMTYDECIAALQAGGFVGTITHVTLPADGADLTKPAGATVSTEPAPGTKTSPSTTIVVTTNPPVLPVVVPAPDPGETADAYIARLQGLGLLGRAVVLPDDAPDPSVGPGEIVASRVSPRPGTRAAPGTTVTVTVNPDTAPDPTPPDPPGPNPPGINLSPLRAASPCSVFPMGVPCWVVDAAQQLSASARAPVFHWTLPGRGSQGTKDATVTVDLSDWSTARDIVHPVLLLAFTIALGIGLFSMSGFGSAAPATKD